MVLSAGTSAGCSWSDHEGLCGRPTASGGPGIRVGPIGRLGPAGTGEAVVRTVSSRYSPDPERLAAFAQRIQKSKNPVLVYGPEIERAGGWDAGIKFAERLKAPVYISPLTDRASFPQTHPQFRGMAPMAIGPLSKKLRGHDLIIVIGAQVFRYYPYVAGEYLPEGAELLQVTSDPYDAAAAIVGDSLLSDAKLALDAFIEAVPAVTSRPAAAPLHIERKLPSPPNSPLTALEAFSALSELRARGRDRGEWRPLQISPISCSPGR